MPYQGFKNKVFSRYNYAVVLVFIVIILLALSISFIRYQSELTSYQEKSLHQLTEQGNSLNSILEQSVQAITGMQKFANYSLAYPDELSAKMPKLSQDEELFYLDNPRHEVTLLDKKLSGNITGFGDINSFSQEKINEIIMANALTPAFISSKMTLPEATWFYYNSLNEFINIYPWIARKNWHYTDRMVNNSYMKMIANSTIEESSYVWSPPYIDGAGTGLNSSLSAGVFLNGKAVGAVVIDINLAKLQDTLPEFSAANHGMVLLNKDNRVLVYKHLGKTTLSPETSWQEVLPTELSHYDIDELLTLNNSQEVDGWLLQKYKLTINDWTLIRYQPYDDFIAPVQSRFFLFFMLFFSGLVAFLALVYLLTRRTFIKPATDFISHIENCAQGDPGKVKPTADWLHWFKLVENIFGQNRSLLQQLKEKNKELDQRVIEKTQALIKSSQQHQRDYALLRSVMNAMPELIIFNDEKDQLIGCNRAFEAFIKKTETVMLGTKVSSLMPASLGGALIELSALSLKPSCQSPDKIAKALLNQEQQVSSHQRVVETPSHTYEVVSRQFFNDVGVSIGTINIFRDVTEQYEIQSALEKAKNQAEYANQAKNQFLANMSHEIRTPINAIQGMMSLLEQTELNTRQSHYLSNAADASSSLLHLIDELLDLSKIEAGKMFISKYPVNIDVIVDKALKLNMGMVTTNDLKLIVDIAADVPQIVMTDELRLVQVLTNLLNNSVKFTHQGEIRLEVELTAKSETNVLVRFSVKDDGIGIAKDKQKHLFDAFSQADESMTREYGGSGLGLSICQQIVNLLGGEITLTSELGEGSEFSFVLPFTLPNTANYPVKVHTDFSKSIMLTPLGFGLTDNLLNAINSLQWNYCQLNSLAEIQTLEQDKQIILLIQDDLISPEDINYLQQISERNQTNKQNDHNIVLLGLCQVATNGISEQISQLLNNFSLPYILLDMPLYRFSIHQLSKALIKQGALNSVEDFTLAINNIPDIKSKENCIQTELVTHLVADNHRNRKENLSGYTILLVEDNLVNQLVAKELLLNMEAEVIIAENGQNALDILAEQENVADASVIDLVLMDIQMPIMDGLTATRLIRQQIKYAHLPIIAMTAHARAEDKDNSYAAGMNLHIAKPISAEVLLSSILSVFKKTAEV